MTICLKYGKIKYVCKKLPQKNDLLRRYKEEADMSLLQAILMGIIQGLTEFLPVSSSGHLAIFKILFGVDTDTGLLFDVLLHIGTLAARISGCVCGVIADSENPQAFRMASAAA